MSATAMDPIVVTRASDLPRTPVDRARGSRWAACRALCLLLTCVLLAAATLGGRACADDQSASGVIDAFNQAMGSGDSTAKRAALKALGGLGKEYDDQVIGLLVAAVNDRQTHDDAVMALRARTGLVPTIYNQGTGYPGYPNSDRAADWSTWYALRCKDKDEQKKIAQEAKALKELADRVAKDEAAKKGGADGAGAAGTAAPGDAGSAAATPPTPPRSTATLLTDDLGHPSRILFKNGGSLMCYVASKRFDSDGILQSVRIIHLDGGGEEILSASLIARIEENVR
jgi:hypothetical protein